MHSNQLPVSQQTADLICVSVLPARRGTDWFDKAVTKSRTGKTVPGPFGPCFDRLSKIMTSPSRGVESPGFALPRFPSANDQE